MGESIRYKYCPHSFGMMKLIFCIFFKFLTYDSRTSRGACGRKPKGASCFCWKGRFLCFSGPKAAVLPGALQSVFGWDGAFWKMDENVRQSSWSTNREASSFFSWAILFFRICLDQKMFGMATPMAMLMMMVMASMPWRSACSRISVLTSLMLRKVKSRR